MLKRNQGIFTAIIGVAVIAAVIAVVTWPRVPQLQAYSYGDAESTQYHPGGAECQPSNLRAIRDPEVRMSRADDCAKEAEEYRQNTSDLIQQTRAANAAEAQAQIASQGLWTAWFQTIGGFVTLAAAIGAAYYAREAAKAGRASFNATVAVEDAALAFEGSNCAKFTKNGEPFWALTLAIHNLGRSSALLHTVTIEEEELFCEATIAAADKFDLELTVPAIKVPAFYGRVQYSSAFHTRSEQEFSFVVTERPATGTGTISTYPGDTKHQTRKIAEA